ncbi:hypothetical protein [Paraburkholderia tropica]|uniref:hypothetical protein n=1 Tax=Paraburkholderia tropica TaxID=92647 RepID=UPI002ABD98EB|nr:hypothetical protein [Paraburkholderia tropica]
MDGEESDSFDCVKPAIEFDAAHALVSSAASWRECRNESGKIIQTNRALLADANARLPNYFF